MLGSMFLVRLRLVGVSLAAVLVGGAAVLAACEPVQENEPNLSGFRGIRPGSGISRDRDAGTSCADGPLASEGVTCDVSFVTDVMPIFTDGPQACGAATCHATSADYDPQPLAGDPTTVWTTLVTFTGGKGRDKGPLPYVNICSLDPEQSAFTCNVDPENTCGSTLMPYLATTPLSTEKREIIRKWLACGAPNK